MEQNDADNDDVPGVCDADLKNVPAQLRDSTFVYSFANLERLCEVIVRQTT